MVDHKISIKTRNLVQYFRTSRESVVPSEGARDFGPMIAFGAKLLKPVAKQWEREILAPAPYEKVPIYPLGSIHI